MVGKPLTICSPETAFLREFFGGLNNNAVCYCILRNYKSLPQSTDNSDIDILIDEIFFDDVCNLLDTLTLRFDGKIIIRLKADRVRSLSLCGVYNKISWGIKFDLFSSYVGTNGCDILSSKDVLDRKFEYKGVLVADVQDAAIVAFIKEIMGAGITRKEYKAEAVQAFSDNRLRYKKALEYYWGKKLYNSLIEPLLCGILNDFADVQSRLRKGWLLNMVRQQPFRVIKRRVVDFYCRVNRFFSPVGFSVAFVGTDGSGKSTIIESIRPPLESALHSTLKYEHMRPNLLPSLARLLGGKPHEPGKPVADPHGSISSGFVGSLLRLSYYSLDYIFGYWFKVYPDKVRKPCLYVFDRYFYDFILDPVRSRISLPKKLIQCFQRIIPEPDLILCLGTEPEVIHARKPELPMSEIKRQVDELHSFCRKNSRAVWIDTGLPVEESSNKALTAIVDRMAARYE